MRGYSSVGAVAALLVTAIPPPVMNRVDDVLAAVEATIDAVTDGAWLTGPIVAERYIPSGPTLYLRSRPVASVQAVVARYANASGTTTLTAGVNGYLLDDLTEGILYLPGYARWERLLVSYTPVATVPPAIAEAATRLAAAQLQSEINGLGGEVKSFSVFGQVSVTYRDGGEVGLDTRLPSDVAALLAPWRRMSGVLA